MMKFRSIFSLLLVVLLYAISSCNPNNQTESTTARPLLLSNIHKEASCVFLTTDSKNNPAVSWVEIDPTGKKYFYFERWNKRAEGFSSPVSIPIEQTASIHEEGMPKIAIKGDGSLFAMYETSVPIKERKWGFGDIHYIQSFDNGKTWTSPKSVENYNPDSLSSSFASLGRMERDGEIGVSWLGTNRDPRVIGRPVKFAKTNGKKGFSKPVLIDSLACQCCRTAIGSDKNGNLSITYRDLLPDNLRDISLSISSDNGETFSNDIDPFSNDDPWKVNGCPHNGPSVAVRNNKTYVTWFSGGRGSGVHYAEMNHSGEMIVKKDLSPNGRFIQLGLLPDGTHITAYDENYEDGDSMYSRIVVNKINGKGIFEKQITPPLAEASYPVVQAAGDNNVVVAWSDRGKVYYKLVNTTTIVDPAKGIQGEVFPPGLKLPLTKLSSNIDPVCGMHLNERLLGDTTLYAGEIIGFCSDHCKGKFSKVPEAYAAPAALQPDISQR